VFELWWPAQLEERYLRPRPPEKSAGSTPLAKLEGPSSLPLLFAGPDRAEWISAEDGRRKARKLELAWLHRGVCEGVACESQVLRVLSLPANPPLGALRALR
jgi:hypothetical protein